MFHQQSSDLQPQPLANFRPSFEEVHTKTDFVDFSSCNYGPYNHNLCPSSYPFTSFTQGFNDLKNAAMPDCNIFQQKWPYSLYPLSRGHVPQCSTEYTQCSSNYQFPNGLNESNISYNFAAEDVNLYHQVKNMAQLEGLDQTQSYARFNLGEYNQIMNNQYQKSSDNGNREKECVKCGIVTGELYRRDVNGNFLCHNCFCASTSIDMLPLHKRNSYKTMSRKQTAKRTGLLCSNCKSDHTTLWRRNAEGQPVCNACGLYYRLHKTARPPSMRKETLQTRKRKTKRKPTLCMKYMQPEYKTEPVNPIDHQMLSSGFPIPPWS